MVAHAGRVHMGGAKGTAPATVSAPCIPMPSFHHCCFTAAKRRSGACRPAWPWASRPRRPEAEPTPSLQHKCSSTRAHTGAKGGAGGFEPATTCAVVSPGVQRRLAMFLTCSYTEHARVSSHSGCVPGKGELAGACSGGGKAWNLFPPVETCAGQL